MMEDLFVPFNLSEKLITLGFNEKHLATYANGNLYIGGASPDMLLLGKTKAPTYDQVFKWFRDKGYDCTVISKDKDQGKFYGGYISYKGEEWSKSIGSNHKTYEEARVACLEKLIEIIENEK